MTVPYCGKRNPGGLTASSPGDTLIFPFASYNDSGDSEALSGLAVGDIEVLKDGGAAPRATDSGYSLISDTGMVGDRVGLYRVRIQLFNTADDASFYAVGSSYQAFIDSVTIDGKTVRFWLGTWEIGEPRANVVQIGGDTGAANQFKTAFANGFNDTGVTNRFDRIQAEVDTGIRTHIDDLDTGLANLNVNLNQIRGDTGGADRFYRYTQKLDTGGDATVSASVDTGLVNNAVWNGLVADHATAGTFGAHNASDTGVNDRLAKIASDTDTGIKDGVWDSATRTLTANTNLSGLQVNVTQLGGDTGALGWLKATFLQGFADTGLNERLARIQSDVDTGLRVYIDDSDTGLKDVIADLDTGLRGILQTTGVNVTKLVGDTGAANWLKTVYGAGFTDTGLYSRLDKLAEDTGGVNINSIQGDTGAAGWLKATFAAGFADTGLNDRLARILADTDTGIQSAVNVTSLSDTGVNSRLAAIQTKTGGLTFSVAGQVDANIQYVNDTQIQGTGDTGTGNAWRPV